MEDVPAKEAPLATRIAGLSLPEKIRLALTGNRDERTILYRDSNKMIKRYVLQNPRIMEDEVLAIARDRNADDEILTTIAKRKEWVKRYPVRLAVATNPKTPVPLAINMLKTLREADLRRIVRSKDVAAAVAIGAKKILVAKGLM